MKMIFNTFQEKAILSTQVLKLEDDLKELKAKQTRTLSDKSHLTQVSIIYYNIWRILDQNIVLMLQNYD